MHYDGLNAENFFKQVMIDKGLKVAHTHKPFDFNINDKAVEVKSAKLWVKQVNGKTIINHGQYECWSDKQLQRIRSKDIWIVFIISHKNGHLIQGFLKSKDLPNKRKFTMNAVERLGLKSTKEFIKYVTVNNKRCVTCGCKNAIEPKVPWGKLECERCREKTGKCLICGDNRNDCCC